MDLPPSALLRQHVDNEPYRPDPAEGRALPHPSIRGGAASSGMGTTRYGLIRQLFLTKQGCQYSASYTAAFNMLEIFEETAPRGFFKYVHCEFCRNDSADAHIIRARQASGSRKTPITMPPLSARISFSVMRVFCCVFLLSFHSAASHGSCCLGLIFPPSRHSIKSKHESRNEEPEETLNRRPTWK